MDSLEVFMKEKYVANPDSRLPVKVIYQDFKEWIIGKYDMAMWNTIPQRKVYSLLKELHEYPYVRFKEGFCLKGIGYRKEKVSSKGEDGSAEGSVEELVDEMPRTQVAQYLTLNILQGNTEGEATNSSTKGVELPTISHNNQEWRGGPSSAMLETDLLRVQLGCPRRQGVILPTLGQRAIKK